MSHPVRYHLFYGLNHSFSHIRMNFSYHVCYSLPFEKVLQLLSI